MCHGICGYPDIQSYVASSPRRARPAHGAVAEAILLSVGSLGRGKSSVMSLAQAQRLKSQEMSSLQVWYR